MLGGLKLVRSLESVVTLVSRKQRKRLPRRRCITFSRRFVLTVEIVATRIHAIFAPELLVKDVERLCKIDVMLFNLMKSDLSLTDWNK